MEHDLDLHRQVNNGRYLNFAGLGRIDWFLRSGVTRLALRQQALPIVGDEMVKFRRDLRGTLRRSEFSQLVGLAVAHFA